MQQMDPAARAGGTPPRKVLVVDDSPVIRSVVQIYLRDRGLDFQEAADGQRALQLVRLMKFDLVIADVRMPGMDGIRFLSELRASAGATDPEVPVILVTGEKSTDTFRRANEAGATVILRKPVSSAGLAAAVDKLLPTGGAVGA